MIKKTTKFQQQNGQIIRGETVICSINNKYGCFLST